MMDFAYKHRRVYASILKGDSMRRHLERLIGTTDRDVIDAAEWEASQFLRTVSPATFDYEGQRLVAALSDYVVRQIEYRLARMCTCDAAELRKGLVGGHAFGDHGVARLARIYG